VKRERVKLTDSGLRCCNPACGVPLYVELMAAPGAEACFECEPEQFREGPSPAVADCFEAMGFRPPDLFERSGGRLPAHAHCSEACCARRKAA
jgi:hypothetical protein